MFCSCLKLTKAYSFLNHISMTLLNNELQFEANLYRKLSNINLSAKLKNKNHCILMLCVFEYTSAETTDISFKA